MTKIIYENVKVIACRWGVEFEGKDWALVVDARFDEVRTWFHQQGIKIRRQCPVRDRNLRSLWKERLLIPSLTEGERAALMLLFDVLRFVTLDNWPPAVSLRRLPKGHDLLRIGHAEQITQREAVAEAAQEDFL